MQARVAHDQNVTVNGRRRALSTGCDANVDLDFFQDLVGIADTKQAPRFVNHHACFEFARFCVVVPCKFRKLVLTKIVQDFRSLFRIV